MITTKVNIFLSLVIKIGCIHEEKILLYSINIGEFLPWPPPSPAVATFLSSVAANLSWAAVVVRSVLCHGGANIWPRTMAVFGLDAAAAVRVLL
jgi:hypothetical protein